MKIPLLGVLIYGIAEASTAYLITKITDPPPPPTTTPLGGGSGAGGRGRAANGAGGSGGVGPGGAGGEVSSFAESQTKWTNKHEFLRLPLANLDFHIINKNRTGEGQGYGKEKEKGVEKTTIRTPRFEGRKFS